MNGDATYYVVRWINSIRTNADSQTGVEFKPLVILAALEILESEQSHPNSLSYSELFNAFEELAAEKGISLTERRFSQPYTRLKNDKNPVQVWIPQPADGVDIDKIDSGNPAAVRRGIPFIKINDIVLSAFLSQEGRNVIRREINDRLFPSMIQGSLFDQLEIEPNENSFNKDISNELDDFSENQNVINLVDSNDDFLLTNSDSRSEEEKEPEHQEYTLKQCAGKTNLAEDTLRQWVEAIKSKGQAILYGPPGTGKTFVAEHLAKHLVGGGNGLCDLVQFHPAYTYEDFIQGIRPVAGKDGRLIYSLIDGRFLNFCKKAKKRQGDSVLIIDEINRANLSQVFGELMYLLEYRGKDIPLAGGSRFQIPKKVLIIGTMNTADRSIALVDYALRRRFAFISLHPDYTLLSKYFKDRDLGFSLEELISILKRINQEINDKNYELGVSFFLKKNTSFSSLEIIWKTEIEPYLDEYFFKQKTKVKQFAWEEISNQLL